MYIFVGVGRVSGVGMDEGGLPLAISSLTADPLIPPQIFPGQLLKLFIDNLVY